MLAARWAMWVMAVLAVGQPAPELALPGTSGQVRRLADARGKVVVLVYEDRDAAGQNQALKHALAARGADPSARQVVLLAVANLAGYDFWPASTFARRAVEDTARRARHEILMDWTGETGRAWGFQAKQSNVVLVDRRGRVRYRHVGPLDPAEQAAFFDALAALVAEPP